jgi:hypothetical protein
MVKTLFGHGIPSDYSAKIEIFCTPKKTGLPGSPPDTRETDGRIPGFVIRFLQEVAYQTKGLPRKRAAL